MRPLLHRLLPLRASRDFSLHLRQRRHVIARAAQVALEARVPVKELQEDVATRFARAARGAPPNISSGQLVQILFEVGVADVKTHTVGEVVNFLMEHGFYRQTHPQKRDSYGPVPPPTLGLAEAQRWATLLFFRRMQQRPQLIEKGTRATTEAPGPICASVWCQCPPGAAGTALCALAKKY
ncbi:LRRC48 [Symbiodinium natans]|uniref:LRRC48 protein n=1 Tax=Symbiodinium natans TaxID=878477 RepID=A0A812GFT0_9DINO|nr:LRRC48 [Symbiodinium natans]